jgi:hypothetical protein
MCEIISDIFHTLRFYARSTRWQLDKLEMSSYNVTTRFSTYKEANRENRYHNLFYELDNFGIKCIHNIVDIRSLRDAV